MHPGQFRRAASATLLSSCACAAVDEVNRIADLESREVLLAKPASAMKDVGPAPVHRAAGKDRTGVLVARWCWTSSEYAGRR